MGFKSPVKCTTKTLKPQLLCTVINSASVIKWQINFSSVFHENCYYKIQINKESFIQYKYISYLFTYCCYSVLYVFTPLTVTNTRPVRIRKIELCRIYF